MVSKKIIEKLSDRELENYLRPDSRFVSKSVRYAFEILKERGTAFSPPEAERIEQLIHSKEEVENQDITIDDKWDKNLTEDETATELYSNKLIWFFSVIFGVPFGTALQVFNFVKIGNKKGAVLSLVFGILFTFLQIYLIDKFGDLKYGKASFRFFLSGIGALALYFIRENMFKNDVKYRPKSFSVPLIITLFIHLVLMYFMFFKP